LWCKNALRLKDKGDKTLFKTSQLIVIELQNAENEIIKHVQQANF